MTLPLMVAAVGVEGTMRRRGYWRTQYSALLMSVMLRSRSGSSVTTLSSVVR